MSNEGDTPSNEDEYDDQLHELYSLVHERTEDLKEDVAALPLYEELDDKAVQVGKLRAYEELGDELLQRLDPELYGELAGADSDE